MAESSPRQSGIEARGNLPFSRSARRETAELRLPSLQPVSVRDERGRNILCEGWEDSEQGQPGRISRNCLPVGGLLRPVACAQVMVSRAKQQRGLCSQPTPWRIGNV